MLFRGIPYMIVFAKQSLLFTTEGLGSVANGGKPRGGGPSVRWGGGGARGRLRKVDAALGKVLNAHRSQHEQGHQCRNDVEGHTNGEHRAPAVILRSDRG